MFVNRADVLSEDEKASFAQLWIRLVALNGPYTETFQEILLEFASRPVAKDIFSKLVKAFNPFP